jgi:hypothetical protein
MIVRSPKRLTAQPAAGELMSRMKAKTLMTALAANAVTPNVRANNGIAGITMPNPSATQKAIAASTLTSRGRPPTLGTQDFIRATIAATFAVLESGRDLKHGSSKLLRCRQALHG